MTHTCDCLCESLVAELHGRLVHRWSKKSEAAGDDPSCDPW